MSPNNGGPAFPSHGSMGEVVRDGMTLRDYFAAKALAGELASQQDVGDAYITQRDIEGLSNWCFRMADAMLAAREGDKA